ncbi:MULTISPECIES: AI-2E family transporter [Azospirillum]|uniref:AI-2E family transporter n=2 Tax=Azospirillum brasilense TaxID=192 RepID=A0ABU4PE87_AZOBR|nr:MULTISPECIES: AI-2E family transporter [Azospirillum]MDW7553209.1 AI-2E family transporter [Azospirillum brasilense]MDW7593412.1 AI-2E family transporter [Azospirillum brasilense]MDW7628528.1 AI-2E family transporter [Azospirillum brasilense]MDX5955377.1 AI-2E family transporter [Azospirillum brasilense]TVZ54486.1 putative PurR-regulated permease PerM [Azospirillum brasilense]
MADFVHDRLMPHADASEFPERYEMSYVRKALVLSMMLILLIGCFVVLRPFIPAILWAVILSFSTWPLHRRIERALGGRTTLAAAIMTLMVMAILVGPLAALGMKLSESVVRVFEAVHAAMDRGLPPLPDWLVVLPIFGDQLQEIWNVLASGESALRMTLQPYSGQIRDWVLESGEHLLSGTSLIALSVLIAFFLYRDGRTAVRRLRSVVGRIAGARARQSLDVAAETINGVVHGVLGTALVQAVAAAVGYWIAGIPGVLFLGFVTFFLTLVPMGPVLIWLPAAIWLTSQGRTGMAIFLVAWVGVLVGSLDNVLRPILIGRSSDLPFIIIFLGIIGGLVAFGLIGIFLGPTLLAVAYGLIREWSGGNEPGDPTGRGTEAAE